MKAKEELNAIIEELETVSEKLHGLTDEELELVLGGADRARAHEATKAALERIERARRKLDDFSVLRKKEYYTSPSVKRRMTPKNRLAAQENDDN